MIQLARALAELDVDVQLFVGGPLMRYLSGLEGIATTSFRWPAWFDRLVKVSPPPVRALGTSLRRQRWLDAVASLPGLAPANVIHVQGLVDTESLLTRFSGPLVVTHWGRVGRWRPQGSSPDHDQALRHRVQRIRDNCSLVAIGEAQGEELKAAGMPPAAVIPPGIDRRHFQAGDRAEARRRVGLPAECGIVLYVGRLASDKNVETLQRAFAGVPQRSRPARLLIVGDGPLWADLQHLRAELGIEATTTVLPFVPHEDLAAYYQACDVTVVPSSRLETFCMVALEAIACGCPLIVTDQVPEIVSRFPAVPWVAPHDVEALCRLLEAALDGQVRPADDAAMDDYDWSGVARRYVELYQTALRPAT
jgi:glycosyltransferase involved in cell wall biosynthesis